MICARSLDTIKEFVYPVKNPDNLPTLEFGVDTVADVEGRGLSGDLEDVDLRPLLLKGVEQLH